MKKRTFGEGEGTPIRKSEARVPEARVVRRESGDELQSKRRVPATPDGSRGAVVPNEVNLSQSLREVEQKVDQLKFALSLIGKGPIETSESKIAELLPYYRGETPMPSEHDREGQRLRREIALHREALAKAELARYRAWMRQKENKGAVESAKETADAWGAAVERLEKATTDRREAESQDDQAGVRAAEKEIAAAEATIETMRRMSKSGGVFPQGIPYGSGGFDADDLPQIPQALLLMLEEDSNIAQKARNAFIIALRNMSYVDTPSGKLCKVFLMLFDEKNRSHIDANDMRMRNRLDNAAFALLAYGIIFPRSESQKSAAGARVGFGLNYSLLERHAEVFITRERWNRLEKRIEAETDEKQKAVLIQEMANMKAEKASADTFIQNISQSFGIKKPGTIFETFGNRLYVNASDLPVFETPQPGDDSKGKTMGSRSLDAALHILVEREKPDEQKFSSPQLSERQAAFSHALQVSGGALSEFERSVQQFTGGIEDDATQFIAFGVLKQLIDYASENYKIKQIIDKTLEKSPSEESTKARQEMFGSLQKLADELVKKYSSLLETLGKLLFIDESNSAAERYEEHIRRERPQLKRRSFPSLEALKARVGDVRRREREAMAAIGDVERLRGLVGGYEVFFTELPEILAGIASEMQAGKMSKKDVEEILSSVAEEIGNQVKRK